MGFPSGVRSAPTRFLARPLLGPILALAFALALGLLSGPIIMPGLRALSTQS